MTAELAEVLETSGGQHVLQFSNRYSDDTSSWELIAAFESWDHWWAEGVAVEILPLPGKVVNALETVEAGVDWETRARPTRSDRG